MADESVPQVVTLDTAQFAIDSTAAPAYDGETRLSWPFGTPAPYDDARFSFGIDFDATDTSVDIILRNFTAGADLASVTSITSDTDFETQPFDPGDISPSDKLGLRTNVDTASGTAGAEAMVTGHLVLVP